MRFANTNSSNSSEPRDPSTCLLYMGQTERTFKILVFIDNDYADMLQNWYLFFSDACEGDNSHLEVICMDNSSEAVLSQFSPLHCSPHSFDLQWDQNRTHINTKLGEIWIKRMDIIQQFLRQGVDLVLTDTDALWMRDPFKLLSQFTTNSDVVASRGWFPWHLFDKWGSCICMGFAYFKATNFSIELIQAASSMMKDHRDLYTKDIKNKVNADDQYSINQQLENWNISWNGMAAGMKDKHIIKNVEDKKRFVSIFEKHYSLEAVNNRAHNGVVVREGNPSGNGQVTLLPHSKFLRSCHNQSWPWYNKGRKVTNQVKTRSQRADIVHCRVASGGHIGAKREYYYSFNLWKAPMAPAEVQAIAERDVIRQREVQIIKKRRKKKRLAKEKKKKN